MSSNRRRRIIQEDEEDLSSCEGQASSSSASSEPKRRRIVRKTRGNVEASVPVEYPSRNIELEPCGTIERIVLKNVFCHDHLDFSGFRLNINLLQGANGSGKSSIVAAIIAGLGGSSRHTDRVQNLKSIIQNGKSSASIEIHLKNKGPFSYKHESFGNSIIVERKILASGSSSYKIMDHAGAAVTSKKDDLKKILDYFNFQVDNPGLILSQERAKTFLSGTKASDLFEFFMRATQLRQCKDDYDIQKGKCKDSEKIVSNKSEDIPQLEKEVKKWEEKVKAISTLQKKRNMLSDLRKAKSWAEVKEMEEDLKVLEAKHAKIESNLEQVAEAMKKVECKREVLRKQRKSFDEEVVETSKRIKHWESELTKRTSVVTDSKTRLRKLDANRKNLEQEKLEREQDVQILREKLQEDNDEVTARWQTTVKELAEKKEAEMLKSMKLQESIGRENEAIQKLYRNLQETEDEFNHCDLQTKAIKSRYDGLVRELQAMQEGGKDRLTVFGEFMPTLVREIDAASKRGLFKAKPIGPLGSFIQVRNSSWVHIVEAVTRGLLHAFLVSCSADQKQLSQIFTRVIRHGRKPQIIVSSFRNRVHDTSRFETVCQPYFSLWSILDVENIQVANTLLDQLQIESILLVPTAEEAANLLIEQRNVPNNCHKAMTLHGDTYFPDPNYRVYSGNGDKRIRFLQVSVEDKIRDLRLNLESTRAEVESSRSECVEKGQKVEEMKKMKVTSNRKLNALQKELSIVKGKIQELINSDPPPPPDVVQLRSDLQENEALKMDVENKLTQVNEDLKGAQAELKEKVEYLKEAQTECENIRVTLQDHQSNTSTIDQELMQREKQMQVLKKKKSEVLNRSEQNEKEINEKTTLVNAKEAEVSKVYPERIESEKSKKELEMEYTAMKNAIEREESLHGSLEEISSTYRIKKQKYEKIREEVKSHTAFVSEFKQMLTSREERYRNLKSIIRLFLSTNFINLIEKRKLVGRIEIDYKKESLNIMMRKDSGDQTHNRLQSLQMMSGGERSYATVSFILALWDVVSSPVRIMDEFEIFMDVVSRQQCMQMIIESAKENEQYILVSPLENKEKSEKLHVFRMPDPERRRSAQESEEV